MKQKIQKIFEKNFGFLLALLGFSITQKKTMLLQNNVIAK